MKKVYDKNLSENIYSNSIPNANNLLEMLKSDDFENKHFALTFINSLEKPENIKVFIKNLINNDTKIRELSSFRISDFINQNNSLMIFLDAEIDIMLKAICDVNPQVCRNICSLLYLSKNKNILTVKILEKINTLIESTKSIKQKNHKTSKDIFNLYWNFYALENLIDENYTQIEKTFNIIEFCLGYKDYTIRERVAFILKKLDQIGIDISHYSEIIRNDENFYVRNTLK